MGNRVWESVQPGPILLRKNTQRLWATPSLNISKKEEKILMSTSFSRLVSKQKQDNGTTNRAQQPAIRQHSQLGGEPSKMQETWDQHIEMDSSCATPRCSFRSNSEINIQCLRSRTAIEQLWLNSHPKILEGSWETSWSISNAFLKSWKAMKCQTGQMCQHSKRANGLGEITKRPISATAMPGKAAGLSVNSLLVIPINDAWYWTNNISEKIRAFGGDGNAD